jgi:hypothetical protein
MKRIAITGGAPVTICPGVINPFGMRWDENGLVFGQGPLGVVRCAANGGKPERLISVAKEELAQSPQILPGGEWVLFTPGSQLRRWDTVCIVAHSLRSGERRR